MGDGQNLLSFDILIRHDKRMNYELIIQISLKILKENTPFEIMLNKSVVVKIKGTFLQNFYVCTLWASENYILKIILNYYLHTTKNCCGRIYYTNFSIQQMFNFDKKKYKSKY